MKVAVAGGTGNIGSLTVERLEREGHEPVPISRSHGIDLVSGDGLADALAGVDAVIDATNSPATEREKTVEFFGATTRNLLAAEEQADVGHHVVLSIVGIDRVESNPHYAGKREQERLVEEGNVPWTIVRATQFHDFAAMVTGWTESDSVATVAPLLVQPIAPADVAEILVRTATGEPQRRRIEAAGPETQDLVDMARRTYEARGREIKLVPTWSGIFSAEMAGEVLLPGEDAWIGQTTFDEWLAGERGSAV